RRSTVDGQQEAAASSARRSQATSCPSRRRSALPSSEAEPESVPGRKQEGNPPVPTATQAQPSTRPVWRQLARRRDYRALLRVRLAGQFADGVFQASLAGAILFNPERAAHAADI